MSLGDDELLERAAALRAEGRAFLDQHAVEQRLAQAGSVELVGSFVTGLMVWRDLDVCVDARDLAGPAAWELIRPLVHAADRVRYEHLDEPDDRRHYFVLRVDGWKLDLSSSSTASRRRSPSSSASSSVASTTTCASRSCD
jgi:hypothetical protein